MSRSDASPPPALLSGLLDAGRVDDDAPAVSDPDGSLTFGQLRERADRLGAVLRDLGVQPGDRVGIHLESSVETMAAVHGVLRCGAVVVPLDPRGPVAHVGGVLRDCGVHVVVGGGSERRVAALGAEAELRAVVGCDAAPDGVHSVGWADVAAAAPVAPVAVDPDVAAYVITTSGSTGRPKGIVHSHRSGMAYARLAAATYGLGPTDVVATLSPLHFDQSTFSLYAAPLAGSCVLMVPDGVLRFPASLTGLVADTGVTVWYSVPTLLTHVVRRGVVAERDLSAIRWVLYGGEAFDPGTLRELMAVLPGARISNVYGPAEVNQCTFHHLEAPPTGDEPVPIGRAWPETEIVVVDDDGEPVAPGEVGEILVCSSTAMTGYWGQPEATDAAFRDRRGASGEVSRWYATGDLGRWREDGELVFVGRADNQVKVRGHRVELEAVDAALAALAGVEAGVAVARRDDEGALRLVALVEASAPLDQRAARRDLARTLPAAAVPDDVVVVDDLPRTATGKIDRGAALRLLTPGDVAPTLPAR